jgi:DNA-binding XRE family transcriptional regulator
MRNFRMSAGLLQMEIVAELGVDNQTVCRWENSGAELKTA